MIQFSLAISQVSLSSITRNAKSKPIFASHKVAKSIANVQVTIANGLKTPLKFQIVCEVTQHFHPKDF